MDREMDRVSQG